MVGIKVKLSTPSLSLICQLQLFHKMILALMTLGITFHTISNLQRVLFSLTPFELYFQVLLWDHFQKL